jgi:hypothetical protein
MAKKALKFDIRAEDKTATAFKAVKSKLGSLTGPLFSVKAALAGVLGAAGVGAVAQSVMQSADEIHKLNLKLGVSTEALSQLKHAAGLSGIEFKTMTKAMQDATNQISDAAQGVGTAKNAIEELGLDAVALNNMAPDQQLLELADAFSQVQNQADKVRLAMDIFGGRGASMLQMLASGRKGITDMMTEADKLGLTLSQTAANDIAAANDAISRMKGSITGLVQAGVTALAPVITDIADGIAYWVAENRDLIAQKIPDLIDDVRFYFEGVVEFFKQNTGMLKMGVVGYFLFGPMGAAVGAMLGSALDRIKSIKSELASGTFQLNEGRSGYERIRDAASGGSFWGDENTAAAPGQPGYLQAAQGGVNINVNQQVSRSDVANIAAEAARQGARQ